MGSKAIVHERIKIWIADPDVVEPALTLIPHDIEVRVNRKGRFLTEQELLEGIRDVDGVVAGVEPYTRQVFEAAERLKIVARRGMGFSEVDLKAATERGVFVTITPVSEEIAAVAEFTIGLILALVRKIPSADSAVKEGQWERATFTGINLEGKRVGLIGMGQIGRAVAQRLKGFGVKLAYSDPYLDPSVVDQSIERMELNQLLAESDVVTLHCNLTAENKNLFDYEKFKLMKRGAYFINTARGALVNEADLLAVLEEGTLAGAALDVYTETPPKSEVLRKLVAYPKVIALPYIGAFTEESLYAMDSTAIKNALRVLHGEVPDYVVNVEMLRK
jgi:phosphoglycerate dehydrogenase-like enzyme